jgi:serine/threonine-protein kinase
MGALYLAAAGSSEMQKLCVIKTVLPHLADAEYAQRFRDEAKVVVRLAHGNLVPVFDAGQVSGELFLAMEFVEGKDLRAVWNRCAKKAIAFPIDVAAYLVKELARGLYYAHTFQDLKLVHRDVSPPNVLVAYSGEVKLTDFGLATSTLKLEKTAPGVVYGKVSYMSPEQARGEPLDGRTDVYAAGIILWELLTGRQLFPSGDAQPADLIARCRDPKVDFPSTRAPRVPKSLDPVVVKALAANRNERYQNGEEFRAALAGFLGREAPATDAARVSTFLRELFGDDIERERKEREFLLAEAAEKVRRGTAPPIAPASSGRGTAVAGSPIRPPVPTPSPVARVQSPMTGATAMTAPAPWGSPSPIRQSERPTALTPPPRVPPPKADGSTLVTEGGSGAALAVAQPDNGGDPVLGTIVADRYRVLSLIGEGGMGRVYAAEHTEIGKRVALKILHPVYGRMPEVVERFRREARAASRIGHPNIVDVTDSGTTSDGSVFFVMEYLEGVELAEVIDREGALPVQRAVNITSQLCRALSAAHAVGIIHRDLKPENVFLVSRDGTSDFVKVLDFGIAKSAELEETRAERLTSPGMAMGTPEYMAPEQAAGKGADARSDIYSVGAILYEMLTGTAPFDGENFMEILTKKATQDARPPRELRPDLSEEVESLVVRTLSRDPERRPQTMESLEYELTKCLAGRGAAVAKVLGMPVEGAMDFESGPRTRPPASAIGFGGTTADVPRVEPSGAGLGRRVFFGILAVGALGAAGYVAYTNLHGQFGWGTDSTAAAVQLDARSGIATGPIAPATQTTQTFVLEPDSAPASMAFVLPPEPDAGTVKRPPRPSYTGPSWADTTNRLSDCNKDIASLNFKAADTCYHAVLNWSPYQHASAYYGLAEAAFNDGRMADAVTYAQQSLSAGGGDDARVLLGDAYLRQGDATDATKMYNLAIAHDPTNQRARTGLLAAEAKTPKK